MNILIAIVEFFGNIAEAIGDSLSDIDFGGD